MPPKPRPVTAKALQTLLTRIGSASSGTKDVLSHRLKRDILDSRLFSRRPEWQDQLKSDRQRGLRVFSIDMGIKNLAFCDVIVNYSERDARKPTMDVIQWDKLNLADATRELRRPLPNPLSRIKIEADEGEEVDPYSLYVLSRAAHNFITRHVLAGDPDIILIESQRWRSASSSAIQQWTVRVNTLEAMLWTTLHTIQVEYKKNNPEPKHYQMKRDYETFGVDPKRVGQFWLGQHAQAMAEKEGTTDSEMVVDALVEVEGDKASSKKIPRSKAEKKAKIAILRSWLATEPASTASTTPESAPNISFKIGIGATAAREALALPTLAKPRKKKVKGGDDGSVAETGKEMKKLDDITDCFLQAAAWVAWESNRLQLYEAWEKQVEKDGKLPDLDDEILKEMVKISGV
ncbi:ribonuclease H-like protein [Phaeosphaeriaceae sp. SRC1lsM3a]|nr:ribonuclease H-like protein [Stagonospora sp. SRC1lsM3a]